MIAFNSNNFSEYNDETVNAKLNKLFKLSSQLNIQEYKDWHSSAELKYNLNHRIWSVHFHTHLLHDINKSEDSQLTGFEINPAHYEYIVMKQQYLFDSIVFCTCSAFDYVGCLIGYLTLGKKKMLWQSLANKAYSSNEIFLNPRLSEKVKCWNQILVKKLFDYRSELIHYEMDKSNSRLTLHTSDDKFNLWVAAPKTFQKKFKKSFNEYDKELTINVASTWLLNSIIAAAIELMEELMKEIEMRRDNP